MRITVLGQPHVVLSSLEAVEDLFESRGEGLSSSYSIHKPECIQEMFILIDHLL